MACVRAHPEQVVGIKARASGNVCLENGPEVLRRSRDIADEVGLPLMLHLGPPRPVLPEMLAVLRAGDILTHCFTDLARPRLVEGERVLAEVLDARERGVVFDVGHGMSGFDAVVARRAIKEGFVPDTISTDVHAYSVGKVGGLPEVANKFLALGMPLAQVLTAVTLSPARAAGLDRSAVGRLVPGGPADVTAVRVVELERDFEDPQGHHFSGSTSLEVALTVQAGSVLFVKGLEPYPGQISV